MSDGDQSQSPPMPVQGAFIWNELLSSDLDKSKAFMSAVAGWTYEEVDMGTGAYTIARMADRQVAGLMAVPHPGMPSQWCGYVWVGDVDAAAAAVKQNGGEMLTEIMHVPSIGRFATVKDPTGAVFAIMTPEMPAP
ncbi:MAG: VOC family protein [Azospirillaceae bacterium]